MENGTQQATLEDKESIGELAGRFKEYRERIKDSLYTPTDDDLKLLKQVNAHMDEILNLK